MKIARFAIAFSFMVLPAHAATMSSITSVGTAQQVDVTTGNFVGWGYTTNALLSEPFFDNTQSGGVVPGVSNSGFSGGGRTYGHTFTFNDGVSPVEGTNVATNGNVTSLNGGDSLTLTFLDIVTPEPQTLNLYLGKFRQGNAFTTVFIDASLSGEGGTIEDADRRSFTLNQQIPNRTPIPFVYTLDFSSDTATDLEIFFTVSNAGGATRNFGISGYTIAAPVAPIPVPAALPLFLSGLGAFAALKGRKAINGTA